MGGSGSLVSHLKSQTWASQGYLCALLLENKHHCLLPSYFRSSVLPVRGSSLKLLASRIEIWGKSPICSHAEVEEKAWPHPCAHTLTSHLSFHIARQHVGYWDGLRSQGLLWLRSGGSVSAKSTSVLFLPTYQDWTGEWASTRAVS